MLAPEIREPISYSRPNAQRPKIQKADDLRFYRFNDFELDRELFRLTKKGNPVSLGRRSFDLLSHLIENYDRVVPIQELVDKVWKAKAISHSAIPTCMMELRRSLNDEAHQKETIETIKGRGYRFVAKLHPGTSAELFAAANPAELALAGRQAELVELQRSSSFVRENRQCRTHIIRGDAGIGKTRLLREFVSSLNASTLTFVFTCPEIDGAPSFLPWNQLRPEMENRLEENSSNFMHSEGLEKTIRTKPTENRRPTLEDRFSLFQEYCSLIRSLCLLSPVTIVLEDIHRADADSIELFDWIGSEAQGHPIMLVATTRSCISDEKTLAVIERIQSKSHTTTHTLDLLEKNEIEAMTSTAIAHHSYISEEIFLRTSGHPFYANHILKAVQSLSDIAEIEEKIDQIPLAMSHFVSYQTRDIPDSAVKALRAGAVLGKQFSVEHCAMLSAMTQDECVSCLSVAVSAGLLCENNSDPTQMRFSHMIFRDSLYDSITPDNRKILHAKAANALTNTESATSENLDGFIAEHLERGLPITSALEAVRYRRAAGQAHLRKFAFTEAKSYLARARSISRGEVTLPYSERCGLRFDLAEAQLYSLDRLAARTTLFEAADIARTAGDPRLLAEAAIRVSPDSLAIEIGHYDPEHAGLLKEALQNLPDNQTALRSRVLACFSQLSAWSESPESSSQLATQSLTLAKQSSSPETLSAALAAQADALHGPDRLAERLETIEQLRQVVQRTRDPKARLMQLVRHVSALLDSGEIHQVDRKISEMESACEDIKVPHFSWLTIAFRAMRAHMKGNLEAANQLGDEFTKVGVNTGDSNVAASRACQLGLILLEENRCGQAVERVSVFTSKSPAVKSAMTGIAMLNLHAGNMSPAIEILGMFDDASIRNLMHEPGAAAGPAFLSEIAVASMDLKKIKLLYETCSPIGPCSATVGYAIAYYGCYHRYAGILAGALDLHSEALEHFKNAIEVERLRGATLWRIHAQLDLARELLRKRDDAQLVRTLSESAVSESIARKLPRAQERGAVILGSLAAEEGRSSINLKSIKHSSYGQSD